jgi:hypothetical protein
VFMVRRAVPEAPIWDLAFRHAGNSVRVLRHGSETRRMALANEE